MSICFLFCFVLARLMKKVTEKKHELEISTLDKVSSDKSDEIFHGRQKFSPTKNFLRRKFCQTFFCPIR